MYDINPNYLNLLNIGPGVLKSGESVKKLITFPAPKAPEAPAPVAEVKTDNRIRWNSGTCHRCGKTISPFETGCPHCNVSFCD
jgi:hypothetical protein